MIPCCFENNYGMSSAVVQQLAAKDSAIMEHFFGVSQIVAQNIADIAVLAYACVLGALVLIQIFHYFTGLIGFRAKIVIGGLTILAAMAFCAAQVLPGVLVVLPDYAAEHQVFNHSPTSIICQQLAEAMFMWAFFLFLTLLATGLASCFIFMVRENVEKCERLGIEPHGLFCTRRRY